MVIYKFRCILFSIGSVQTMQLWRFRQNGRTVSCVIIKVGPVSVKTQRQCSIKQAVDQNPQFLDLFEYNWIKHKEQNIDAGGVKIVSPEDLARFM